MTILANKKQYLAFKAIWAQAAQTKQLTSAHHLFYNLVVGREYTDGFTPLLNPGRIQSREYGITTGLCSALRTLRLVQDIRFERTIERFIEPFGDNREMVRELLPLVTIPDVPSLTFNFGIGKKLYSYIVDHNIRDITYPELWEMMNRVVTQPSAA